MCLVKTSETYLSDVDDNGHKEDRDGYLPFVEDGIRSPLIGKN